LFTLVVELFAQTQVADVLRNVTYLLENAVSRLIVFCTAGNCGPWKLAWQFTYDD